MSVAAYLRVSTNGQTTAHQLDHLARAGMAAAAVVSAAAGAGAATDAALSPTANTNTRSALRRFSPAMHFTVETLPDNDSG
jgi:hypothetical protein